ncbi:hypothetical protein GCM10017784_35110 [Deinococcus indicus]|uniref:hypothetical protein n=1 Tax=Deinococcus indicus TaxID=223556 RepID=UPI00174E8D1F|nr:hypothetical protein [Deinococcus indicus]GHG37656.1 hypothetical protein GCM10017784_35110 [Deinococcus indicus]
MTAPTLPETLARLAQLLPSRVRGTGGYKWSTFYVSSSMFEAEAIWSAYDEKIDANPLRLHLLEFALREECEARGWMWRVWAGLPGHGFGAEVERGVLTRPFEGMAEAPAHALALAMISALGGETTP